MIPNYATLKNVALEIVEFKQNSSLKLNYSSV